VRWETKQSFDGQLYQKYSYQNLLKLDNFSSSYDEKKFGVFYALQCSVDSPRMTAWKRPLTFKKSSARRPQMHWLPKWQDRWCRASC